MAIFYKIDIIKALKEAGWSSYRIRKEKIIGEQQMTQIRNGEIVSTACLDKICKLLNCQPGDILEYAPTDNKNGEP
ncbi:MAG: helix-turn-helix transcriptional regulator [Clostridia bacterium]|nr:helix-turn-helix transcriptional regulator [Clostridia bacterium]